MLTVKILRCSPYFNFLNFSWIAYFNHYDDFNFESKTQINIYVRSVRDPVQQRLGPKPFRPRSPQQGNGQYDSGLERDEQPLKKPQSIDGSEAETEVRL